MFAKRMQAPLKLALLFSVSLYQIDSTSQPLIASPAPNSSVLARFAEIPIDQSTGVPGINTPLYTIHGQKLSYPVSLSYHASGVKVDDVASPVGLGWALNAGGIITRVMRGKPDEQANCYFSFALSIPDAASVDETTMENLATGIYDMMPDLFYFNIGIDAGKFLFDNSLTPRTIPRSDLKITPGDLSSLSTFTIATTDGTTYAFEAGESSTLQIPNGGSSFPSTWYLTRIVSVDKVDTIRFNYTTVSQYSYTTSENASLKYFYDAPAGASRALGLIQVVPYSGITTDVTGTQYLNSIEFKTGKLQFGFSAGREDYAAGKKLDNIIIYCKDPITHAYAEERRINFNYSYFDNTDNTTKRLRLDSIQEQYPASIFDPPTVFTYSTHQLPPPGSSAQDTWGYYNGATSNTNLIPAFTWGTEVLSTNNREVNPSYVDGCILSKITAPLGGVTEFYFESNTYNNNGENFNGPGLRIQKIIKKDPYSNINAITNYDYKNPANNLSSGILVFRPNPFIQLPVRDLSHGTVYNYNCLMILVNGAGIGNFSGPPLVYEYATVYHGDDVNVAGKTVSKFSLYSQLPVINYPFFPPEDNSWLAGRVLSNDLYKVESNVSTPVKKISYRYTFHSVQHEIKGLSVAYNRLLINGPPIYSTDYAKSNFYTYSKFHYCDEKTSNDFEQNSGAIQSSQTENYFFESSLHTLPTKVVTTTSETGTTLSKEFTYPLDYPAAGVLGAMQNLNMMAYPVETISSRIDNGIEYVIGYDKVDYEEWITSKVYPKFYYQPKIPLSTSRSAFDGNRSGFLKLRSKINQYDAHGNPHELQQIGGEASANIYDPFANGITAVAVPAKATQIAYSGFESSDFGQWVVTAGTQNQTRTLSLNRSNTFKSFEIQADQSVTYTYSVTRDAGPSPLLIFSKTGATPIQRALTGTSGSGNVSLTAGAWTVSLSYDFNVQSVSASFTYQYVQQLPANIVGTDSKTGSHALTLNASHLISRTGMPVGDYVITYFQKNGTVNVVTTGSSQVTGTVVDPVSADGWSLVTKTINISNTTDAIQLSSSSAMIDELRLYPAGARMNTKSFDAFGRAQTVTDQNLRSQYYFFDERSRVKMVRDNDRSILQQYEYKIAGN
jgi:hypothetical protein